MARVSIDGDRLHIEMRGWEAVWALKRRIDVPLSSIVRVAVDPVASRRPEGLRAPGSYLPGVIAAGTYRGRGKRAFWSVRHPENAIVIDLASHHYTRVVLEVGQPQETIAAIDRALGADKN